MFFGLDLVGISMQQTCGVVGIHWIEQGIQTDPNGGLGRQGIPLTNRSSCTGAKFLPAIIWNFFSILASNYNLFINTADSLALLIGPKPSHDHLK